MNVPPANGGYSITRIHVDCRTSSDGGTTWSGWFACTAAAMQVNPVSGSTLTAVIDSTDNYSNRFTYQARARARNSLGASWDWRESAVIAPITLSASSIGIDAATLTITGHTGGWWHQRTAPSGDTTCHSVTSGRTTTSLSSLTSKTSYTYKAYRQSGCSAGEIASHTFATVGVSVPTALGASQASGEGSSTVTTIDWTSPANETGEIGYTVQCSSNSGTTWPDCKTVAATATANLRVTYTPGEGVTSPDKVRLRSSRSKGENTISSTWMESGIGKNPRSLSASYTNGQPSVSWKNPDTASYGSYSYHVESSSVSGDGATWTRKHTVAATSSMDLSRSVIAKVRVRAINSSDVAGMWVEATRPGPANVGAQIQSTTLKLRREKLAGVTGSLPYVVECNNSESGGT